MNTCLLGTVCSGLLLLLSSSQAFSTEINQPQSQATFPENTIMGENPAIQKLVPPPEPQTLQVPVTGNDYKLRVVYMIPSNRTPQPQAEQDLQRYVLRMQDWFKDHMERLGYGPKTFQYEAEADGVTPKVNIVPVIEPDTYFHVTDANERFYKILDAIENAGFPPWQDGELLLVVAEIQVQLPDGDINDESGLFLGLGIKYSGVGMINGTPLALFSEDYLVDDRPYDGLIIPGIGPYPMVQDVTFPWFTGTTLSSVSSSFQGGALHELGHGLGLEHDVRNDDNFNGNLMGNGFRGIRGGLFPDRYPDDDARLSSASALQLNYSRFFNPEQIFTDNTPPQAQILTTGTVTPVNGLCPIEFSASDADSSLAGVILLREDEVVADMRLDGGNVSSSIATYDYIPGVENDWKLLVFDTQGNRITTKPVRITCAAGFNQAPKPFIQISRTTLETGEEVFLDASRSSDPDGDDSRLTVEWDLDGDGVFDTSPSTNKTYSTSYAKAGIYQVIARVTDEQGASSQSMPIGIRVEEPHILPVSIDIKPGNARNDINPREKGEIWVAILSETNPDSPFDPSSQVNISTVSFGSDGAKAIGYKVKDINNDGLADLLLRFKITETGIICGDTEASLTGELYDGRKFTGTDAIKTVGCKPRICHKKKLHNKCQDDTHYGKGAEQARHGVGKSYDRMKDSGK